ncbi:thiolase family protein [Streptomyces sp. 7N604]|uniref:thiolase family protein n=1 Tax=Streptomyces sp. 7N604 TaxID=3457415 RepID=UPI003FD61EEF
MNGQRPIVVAARRTPIGRFGGAFATMPIHELLRPVLTALLDDLGVTGADIDDVIVGNAGGSGGNPAPYVSLTAGLGIDADQVRAAQRARGVERSTAFLTPLLIRTLRLADSLGGGAGRAGPGREGRRPARTAAWCTAYGEG